MGSIKMGKKQRPLEFSEWISINDVELDCIFGESGADRELDFDYEQIVEDIYERGETKSKYAGIIWNI